MIQCTCAHCKQPVEVDWDTCDALNPGEDPVDGDCVECPHCQKENYFWNNQLVTVDDYHEFRCDSIAAARFEDRAYGRDSYD